MLIMGNVEQVISKKRPHLIDACTQLKKRGSKQALFWFLTRNYYDTFEAMDDVGIILTPFGDFVAVIVLQRLIASQ